MSGLPRWLRGKESACQCRRPGLGPWIRKIPWRRKRQPTPVFLPRKSHGQRSLEGVSPWGCRESDMTEHTCTLGTYVTIWVQKICGKSDSYLQWLHWSWMGKRKEEVCTWVTAVPPWGDAEALALQPSIKLRKCGLKAYFYLVSLIANLNLYLWLRWYNIIQGFPFIILSSALLSNPVDVGNTNIKHKLRMWLSEYVLGACYVGGEMGFSTKSLEKIIFLHKKMHTQLHPHRHTHSLHIISLHPGIVIYGKKSHLLLQAVTITEKIYCRKLVDSNSAGGPEMIYQRFRDLRQHFTSFIQMLRANKIMIKPLATCVSCAFWQDYC